MYYVCSSYMLYYALFYIQRFCYLSWIYGMWNKLQLQLQEHSDKLKRERKYNNIVNTTAHNLAYAAGLRTEREHRMYLVCSVLDLSKIQATNNCNVHFPLTFSSMP